MNMDDYRLLEKSSHLSEYQVIFPSWKMQGQDANKKQKIIRPFKEFSQNQSPEWYSAYNKVKHNRKKCFSYANLENCVSAIAGILVLLYSQFGSKCIETYGINLSDFGDEDEYDDPFDTNIIFEIKPLTLANWSDDEVYNFKWEDICNQEEPFNKFDFNA